MPPFPRGAETALGDATLRGNLRHATHTIRDKRARAVAELPDWAELRSAGAALKDRSLRHLDRYLTQAEAAITAAGGRVHWASDASAANRIVTRLVRDTGEPEVVKVKSMATQEIELNEALEAAGIAVHETDLAELIVQLGDDLPSHLLVPAIHRNRSEIRDIFRERMADRGRPAPEGLTDDPRALAEAARLHLREKFLRARVAVSGANFLIAETGTLVVVESEGNGRMCLTLPDTLISVVGIEKVVPTWRDLEVFLQTLPRSSTAERMNPYTSTWTGVTPGDGPQSCHVVLLDNGRTDALADTVGRQALRCIRCSACLNVCPVYERAGGHAYGSPYPGPIGAILTPQLRGTTGELDASLPFASSLCGACHEVCPVAIDIPEVLVHLRERVVQGGPVTLGGRRFRQPPAPGHRGERAAMRAARLLLDRPALLARAQWAAGRVRHHVPARLPGAGREWTDTRDAPRLPERSFRSWWREQETSAGDRAAPRRADLAAGGPGSRTGGPRDPAPPLPEADGPPPGEGPPPAADGPPPVAVPS
ncbi:lactate utilization protein, partial [Streptomyces sp. ventii]